MTAGVTALRDAPGRARGKVAGVWRAAQRRVLRRDVINKGGAGVVDMIDVGSVGGLADEWRDSQHLVRRLLNFEPLQAPRRAGSVLTVPAALWSSAERRSFYIAQGGNGTGDSLLAPNTEYVRAHFGELRERGPRQYADSWFDRSATARTITLDTTTLDAVLASLDEPSDYDFLKIDAQGADLEILKGADAFLRSGSCVGIQLEAFTIPLYVGVPLLPDFDEWLGHRGFARVFTAPAHGTFDSQHNVLYLRSGAGATDALRAIRHVYGV